MNEWNNPFQAFVTKRKSFEYENEIRAVTCLPDDRLKQRMDSKNNEQRKGFFV